MFGCGRLGLKHPNGKFPFIYRQEFVGGVHYGHWLICRLSHNIVLGRDILGFGKRLDRKD